MLPSEEIGDAKVTPSVAGDVFQETPFPPEARERFHDPVPPGGRRHVLPPGRGDVRLRDGEVLRRLQVVEVLTDHALFLEVLLELG